jgi:hypothetical protein
MKRLVILVVMVCVPLFATAQQDTGQLRLSHPTEVATDSEGRIYFNDKWNSRIIRVDDISGRDPVCGFQKLWRSFSRYSGGIFSWLSHTVKLEMTGAV